MDTIKISLLIVGSIIGAGFASGKEIYQYFAKFGSVCFILLPILFLVLFFSILLLLKLGQKLKINYINELNGKLFKNKNTINIFTFLTFLILSAAMFSGIYNLFLIYFNFLNKYFLIFLCVILTYFLSFVNIKTFSLISNIIVPIIIVLMCINCGSIVLNLDCFTIQPSFSFIAIILPFLYAFQNVFLSSFVIVKSAKTLSKSSCFFVSLISSTILTLLLLLGCLALLKCPMPYSSLPFVETANSLGKTFGIFYGVVMFFAVITTYITTLTTLQEFFGGKKFYNKKIFMIILVCVLGLFDFKVFVKNLYPIIGIIGFLYLAACKSLLNKTSAEDRQNFYTPKTKYTAPKKQSS